MEKIKEEMNLNLTLTQFLNQDLNVTSCFSFAQMPGRGTKLSAGIDFYIPKCNSSVTDYNKADKYMMEFLNSATNCVNQKSIIELWNKTLSQNKESIYEWSKIINTFILLTCINEELTTTQLVNQKLDIQMNECLVLDSLHDVLIPSGIKVDMLPNTMFTAFNKSGVAGKRKMLVGACVVDIDYRGQVHLNLHNISHKPTELRVGDKITQFVIIPIILGETIYISSKEYDSVKTERGNGAFGSTNK